MPLRERECRSLELIEDAWIREQVRRLDQREAEDRAADPFWEDEHELGQYAYLDRRRWARRQGEVG